MKLASLFFLTLIGLAGFEAHAERTYIRGGRAGGYDTAYCPRGFQIESCDFNPNTCDNTRQGRDFCSADSRNNRPCNFTGVCFRREPHRVRISGGRRGGYDTAYCPRGYVIDRCNFDNRSCDNTRQGNNFCSADSRNNRDCRFDGVCVRW